MQTLRKCSEIFNELILTNFAFNIEQIQNQNIFRLSCLNFSSRNQKNVE